MYFSKALFGLAAIAGANAAIVQTNGTSDWTVQVLVGPDSQLEFIPNDIIAPVGSKIEFLFNPKNHSVIQSSFAKPCQPLANGFFSSFVPTTETPASTTFTVTVENSNPIWFYCGQTTGNHCQSGMVGSINAPRTGNTLEKFIALAKAADKPSTSPSGGAVGGVLSNNTVASASSSLVTAVATDYAVSTWTTNGHATTATVSTATVFETVLLQATEVAAPSNTGSSSSSPSSTSTGAAAERTAHLFGAAAIGLGALAFM